MCSVSCVMQKKKKKKTVIEKYWDWELTNETQPLWVSIFFSFETSKADCFCQYEARILYLHSFISYSFEILRRLLQGSTMNSTGRLSMNTWIP